MWYLTHTHARTHTHAHTHVCTHSHTHTHTHAQHTHIPCRCKVCRGRISRCTISKSTYIDIYVTHSYLGELNVMFDTHTHIYAYVGAPYLSLYMLTYMVYTYIFRRAICDIWHTHTPTHIWAHNIWVYTYWHLRCTHTYLGELNVTFDTYIHTNAYLGAPYLNPHILTYMVYTYIYRRAICDIWHTHTHTQTHI